MKRIVWLIALVGCLGGPALAGMQKADPSRAPKVPAGSTAPVSSLTDDAIRALVRQVDQDLRRYAQDLLDRADRNDEIAECYGYNRALRTARVSDIRTLLARFVTGHATQCYQASYFGCTVGEWIGRAGLATMGGPEHVAHRDSKVTIVDRTHDRIVADVSEPPGEYVSAAGVLDRRRYAQRIHNDIDESKARYTFTRAIDGKWLIADRVANYEWECGDGEARPLIKDAR